MSCLPTDCNRQSEKMHSRALLYLNMQLQTSACEVNGSLPWHSGK